MLQQIQIAYSQGLVKTFLASQEILLCDMVEAARRFGKLRSVRFLPDVDVVTANQMIASGNAVNLKEGKRT